MRKVFHALDYEWLLSCGNDKYFQCYCTNTGKRIAGYASRSYCNCLQFDSQSSYLFLGNNGGEIHVLKLSQNGLKAITTLNGHSGRCFVVKWDKTCEKKVF